MSENIVLTSVNDRGIAEVILNRPQRNNAYNGDMIIELIKSFESLYKNNSVRVVLIKGNGKHFQAGADLQWLKEIGNLSQKENIEVSRKTASAIQGLTKFPKPTIALIHGGCFGGGTGIAAAADIVIASEDAIFSISEAKWGVMAGIIIPHLNASIGVRNVRRYALTSERFNASHAKEMGLVHQVCRTGDLENAVKPVIEDLLMCAPDALEATKRRTLIESGLMLSDEKFDELVFEPVSYTHLTLPTSSWV